MDRLLYRMKKIIPANLYGALQPAYHYILAFLAACIYRFPSRKINIIAITGTKGKSSTAEIVNAILEESGRKTALASTIRFKIGGNSKNNLRKMTLPGRMFLQKFLRKAVNERCEYAIVEITSEASKQFRNKFVDLNSLIFTNISPEHIESHGSYEKYLQAKLNIAKELENSKKRPRTIAVNADDNESPKFLSIQAEEKVQYSLEEAKLYRTHADGIDMMFRGETIHSKLKGVFNVYNILSAASFAETLGISPATIKRAVERLSIIKGRAQNIDEGQDFEVIVDYAHTSDSLEKLYQTFSHKSKICVLGNTGGGRDTWKRPVMAQIADKYCDYIILTNEDPYDENPRDIIKDMLQGIKKIEPEIIMDRKAAIRRAFQIASSQKNSPGPKKVVLLTGKGTDPYIMGPGGTKTPWSDEKTARDELRRL
ncbi:MAG: hypothetical protein A3G52_01755 [Candidatus Taylorbacteria bacterium RIFCSPLOWO2_12_FULL_43_20]|uniref:UDP-N-acetylmuramoyl-L-alanyl-D-glutamate--2, 6-diaminopimelate ligase n=1 Tax=Candidatus Taylorbacteria bacterium RIFCSPLOWO2_12_FULL_43_20 TaxID=1802332 RepID=A0A1G2P0Z5_9BACT|nr:MAG: hypothetical protein A3B98_00240 [Candidatus Taylorbacteria bacterium RIFCSPHIGHO2_02_FULL_43_55]OHA29928.1 MAG: hypothetical protein A3E92_03870 [Candidatus Taylorbacteria bacterium RIFCSPHIGHO2_12_FULL_42_34]OHA30560.1 MAG: hypothetical protein A3B09_01490 [Candidatus Taylorbacteria bacterium RIFCSPLOWO2_01_FULL_43_83]OHA38392.1 MAG: hypothetical protein A3H58_04295 [Candidatus Taylorbacteria bacterium RIFCSPLOWO2_02_FULL_43_22b]OHA42000.1 MAG: hypothetical protein A3G52_01755 [Candid